MKKLNLLFLIAFCFIVLPAQSQDNEPFRVKPKWNYSDKFIPDEFNLLTLMITNKTDKQVDGPVTLKQSGFTTVGENDTQRVILNPGETKIVQFYPYVSKLSTRWSVDLFGVQKEPIKVFKTDKVLNNQYDAPESVYFYDSSFDRPNARYDSCDEALFPISVVATKTLQSVVLDHQPEWRLPQKRAFFNWLPRV